MDLSNRNDFFAFIDQHMSAKTSERIFYHYTTVQALLGGLIVKEPKADKEISLWATHRRYLNDNEELELGIKELTELLQGTELLAHKATEENIRKRVEDTYLTSFSLNPNSLYMWNMYANNGCGIALGFKRIKSIEDDFLCLKCCYEKEEIYKLLNHFLDNEYPKYSLSLLLSCIPSLRKNNAYYNESEIRLVGDLKEDNEGNYKVQYRAKNGYLIPYKVFYLPKEQLTSITIGPCLNFELTKKSLQMFLKSKGFKDIEFIKSDIPYRNNL